MLRSMVVVSAIAGVLATATVEVGAQVRDLEERVVVGRPAPGWVGISFRNSPPPAEDVVVEDVVDEAPAERAGVLVGDRIVQWNGRTDVREAIRGTRLQPGDTVRVRVRRPGARDRDMVMVAVPRPFPGLLRNDEELRQTMEELSSRLRGQSDSLRVRSEQVRAAGVQLRERLRGQLDSLRLRTDSLRRAFPPDSFTFPEVRMMFDFPRSDMNFEAFTRAIAEAQASGSWPPMTLERFQDVLDSAGRQSLRSFRPDAWSAAEFRDLPPGFGVTIMGGRNAVAGAELTDLGAGLASYFGAGSGALVLRVLPSTPAERAGLQDGDVIVSAGGREVTSVADLRRALAESTSRPVQVDVIRHRARRTVTIGGEN